MRKKIILFYRNDFMSFNLTLGFVLVIVSFLLNYFLQFDLNITFSIALAFILFLNYGINKISKKYVVQTPIERDTECEGYLLLDKSGYASTLNKEAVWAQGGKLLKVKSSSPGGDANWRNSYRNNNPYSPFDLAYSVTFKISDIFPSKTSAKLTAEFYTEKKPDPLEIYKIYKENNLEIIDNILYMDLAFICLLAKANEANEEVKKLLNKNINENEHVLDAIVRDLIIPNFFSGVKSFAIYRKYDR